MAIIKIGVIFILLLAFSMLCVSATDIGTGTFTVAGSDGKTFDVGYTASSHEGVTEIMFNDASAVEYASSITCKYESSKWGYSNTSENAWWDVTYKVGGTTVGTGTFGWNKAGNGYHYVTAFFNEDFSMAGYSGVTYVIIDGIQVSAGHEEIEIDYWGNLPADADAVGFHWKEGHVMPGNYQYNYIYSTSNDYVYGQDNSKNYLDVSRTAETSSQYLITTVEREIVNETSPGTSDDSFYDTNFTNTQWTVYFSDPAGHTSTYYLNFDVPAASSIEWGADSYVIDDTGSYSWSMTNDDWDTVFYSKKASIYRDETMVHEVSLPSQTGTFFYTFLEEGSFTVKLRHTSALLPHETLDTDTIVVTPMGDSYIYVNNTIVVGQHFDINFSYGFTPSGFSTVKGKHFDTDTSQWLFEKEWSLTDLHPITPNTIYQVSGTHKIHFEGSYIFELYDPLGGGVVATTPVITAMFSSTTPTLNISNSYINITKTDYIMGEIMNGFCGIDKDNFTFNNYLVVYNYQYDTTTMESPITEQAGSFYGNIVQTDIHGDWIHGGEIPVIPGNNKISVYAENSTTRFEVVYVNFTVSAYDDDGYGLQLSSYDACINEEILITVISPTDANLTIFSPTGMPIKTYTLNGSTTIKYWFPTSGMYSIELYKSGEGIPRATVTIYISDCAEGGIIEPPSGEMDDMYLNMFNVMTLPAFWGMIIFIGFIGGLAIKRDKNGDALVSGNGLAFIAFGLLNLLSIIGLFAPYTFYIIVSTWIFAGMFFGVGKYLARGEG